MRKQSGGNLIEYVVPIAVVGIGVGLAIYTGLSSGNLLGFISNSADSEINMSEQKMTIGHNVEETGLISQQRTVAGQKVYLNDDGSISFSVSGQDINIPPQAITLQGIVLGEETAGVSGSEDLVKEITYLINKYKNDYPGGDMPIDIAFGSGKRRAIESGADAIYEGTASVNSTTIKVGDHLIIYQNDQTWKNDADLPGYFRIEANKQSNGSYKGKVTGNTKNNSSIKANIVIDKETIDTGSSSLNISKALVDNMKINNILDPNARYNWNFNFDNPENFFSVTN